MKFGGVRGAARGGCAIKLLIFFLFVGAATALAWMLLLPVIFTQQIRSRTGFDADVTSLAVNPFSGRVVIRGLVLTNPPEFPVKDFLQLRTFEADADLWSYFGEKFIVHDLTIDIRKLTLVKRADGRTNFLFVPTGLGAPKPVAGVTASHTIVRKLHLRFDTVALVDQSARPPVVREYPLNFERTFTNISDPKQILLLPEVLAKMLPPEALTGLAGFVPGDLGKALSELARSGGAQLKSAEQKATDVFHGLLDKLEELRKP